MEMIEHTIVLHGESCHGRRAKPEVVGKVLQRVPLAIRDTVRMSFLRSSRVSGRPIADLRNAWDIEYLGQSEGPDDATRMHFEAPTFGSAAPRVFEQGRLWEEGPSRQDTAFDVLGDTLQDVARRAADSDKFDVPLLTRFAGFDRVLGKGLDWIALSGHRIQPVNPPVIDRSLTDIAQSLAAATPAAKRVRVQGTLDMIRVSDRVLELILGDGTRIRAVWTGETIVGIRDFLNQSVLIEGNAVFRSSGSLLRIDTEAILPASGKDTFFSTMPKPDVSGIRNADYLQPQTATTGFRAIFGRWPGDETDEDIIVTMQEIG